MNLLIVGKLEGYLTQAMKLIHDEGAKVTHCETIDKALQHLQEGKGANLVMIDVTLPIKQFIDSLRFNRISVEVVACGIGTDSKLPVEAIKAGAKEYVPLPPNPELIAAILQAATTEVTQFLSQDPKMREIFMMVDKIAPSDASILITGESGTGKEVMARFIHSKSHRNTKPFVAVNCAAIPDNLLESELFGHEKGAFTGAQARRVGKFEEANGGTLLLDEISEMHPRLQAKLLRAIQEREIDRIGGMTPIKVNIRLLATSNRNLVEEVKAKNFRQDLYFRLAVIHLNLPPLRERPKDIELLAEHFNQKYCQENNLPARVMSDAALEAMKVHSWEGNTRQLQHAIYRAVLLAQDGTIRPEDLGIQKIAPQEQSEGIHNTDTIGKPIAEIEKRAILGTLEHCLGNRTHAAQILGISIRTLRNKLHQYAREGNNIPSQYLQG